MSTHITYNDALGRYELPVEGHIVFANVRRDGKTLMIDHVEAPPALRGKGAASVLMQELVDLAKKEGLEIVPVCGYAAAWLQRHSQ